MRTYINRDWRFFRGDAPHACEPSFDDSHWQRVGLPHCFDLPYFRTPEFYVGIGWYRKRFTLTAEQVRQNIRIDFGAAFQVADVYCNGKPAGTHRGGYTSFNSDLSAHVHSGENLLAVCVSNEWKPRLAPRAGEHIFSGGLYRDVQLVVQHPIHVRRHGIEIRTTVARSGEAQPFASIFLTNFGQPLPVLLRMTIFTPDGAVVGIREEQVQIAAGYRFDFLFPAIDRPMLWHPDHPHLYRAVTEVIIDGQTVDREETAFGIRKFEWTADRGFFLNGVHLYLRGANAHQDHSGWGIGITQAAHRRDVQLLKDAGFNFVRGSHYPHHPAVARACDEIGMIFLPEFCFWGKGGFGPEGYWNASAYPANAIDFEQFDRHCTQALSEMMRENCNSPSIVAWSLSNEPFFTYNLESARKLLAAMTEFAHGFDHTRPVMIGGAQRGEIDHLGDIAGYNGDGARLFHNPGVPNIVTEYGAISKPPDADDLFLGDLKDQPRLAWRAGEAIWCGFDYGTIAGKQGLKGVLRHNRLPKQSWHAYRKALRGIDPPPRSTKLATHLNLTADRTVLHGGEALEDSQVHVFAADAERIPTDFSGAITLTIESGPGEFPTGSSITFDPATDLIPYMGEAAVAFRSYHAGLTTIRATADGLTGAVVTIETVDAPPFEGRDLRDERPYVPPPVSPAAVAALGNAVNVARDRPSRASSERSGHPARFANDANVESRWIALESSNAWWQVDMEGFYQISGGRIVFPAAGNWRYTVQISPDGAHWSLAADRSQTVRTDIERNEIFEVGITARFLRITFVSTPADHPPALCEVEVHGVLSVR